MNFERNSWREISEAGRSQCLSIQRSEGWTNSGGHRICQTTISKFLVKAHRPFETSPAAWMASRKRLLPLLGRHRLGTRVDGWGTNHSIRSADATVIRHLPLLVQLCTRPRFPKRQQCWGLAVRRCGCTCHRRNRQIPRRPVQRNV
jgi:hypothetical protein